MSTLQSASRAPAVTNSKIKVMDDLLPHLQLHRLEKIPLQTMLRLAPSIPGAEVSVRTLVGGESAHSPHQRRALTQRSASASYTKHQHVPGFVTNPYEYIALPFAPTAQQRPSRFVSQRPPLVPQPPPPPPLQSSRCASTAMRSSARGKERQPLSPTTIVCGRSTQVEHDDDGHGVVSSSLTTTSLTFFGPPKDLCCLPAADVVHHGKPNTARTRHLAVIEPSFGGTRYRHPQLQRAVPPLPPDPRVEEFEARVRANLAPLREETDDSGFPRELSKTLDRQNLTATLPRGPTAGWAHGMRRMTELRKMQRQQQTSTRRVPASLQFV